MKHTILLAGLLALGGVSRAQNPPVDCSGMTPTLPYGQTKLDCPIPATPNNNAGRILYNARSSYPTLDQCRADLASWEAVNEKYVRELKKASELAKTKMGADWPLETEKSLSVEELMRRQSEAIRCEAVLHSHGYDSSNRMIWFQATWLRELYDRAETVLDRHLLLNDLIQERGQ